jgi:deazaflavin-dependent oxidoreductase (nitroreductase family)
LFQRTLYRIDRPLHRWTGGRVTLPGLATGLPVIMLTTTGAKSGLKRTMPVAGIPLGDDLVILGTNYAQQNTPGWVFNLLQDPRAVIEWKSTRVEVVASVVDVDRMDEVWQAAGRVYVGFPKYPGAHLRLSRGPGLRPAVRRLTIRGPTHRWCLRVSEWWCG